MYLDKQFKTKRRGASGRENTSGLLLSLTPVIGFAIFGLIPMLMAIYMAFFEIRLGYGLGGEFVGFDNFKHVLTDPAFGKSIGNTFIMALSLPICLVLSLIVAFLLTKNIKGKKAFRTIYFIPYVCCTVAVSLMWELIFNQSYGILNAWLGETPDTARGWLTDSQYYLPCLIVMGIWSGTAYGIILYGAALTNVNGSLYEAAKVDGAGAFKSFFHITLPAISPTTFYLLVTGLIGSLQEFTRPNIISGNGNSVGPNNDGLTMVFYVYKNALDPNYVDNMGIGAAAAWILAIFIIIITVLNFALSKKWVSYD